MPIDPEARSGVVSALSAFMRGEIDNFAFDDAIHKSFSKDSALEAVRTSLWYFYDDCKVHSISVNEEGWNYLRRALAFLKSGLEEAPVRRLEPTSARRGRFLLGLASLVLMIWSAYMAITDEWYWLLLPGTVLGLPYFSMQLARANRERASEDPHPFYPFSSAEQWGRYEPLLAGEHLPMYNPEVHHKPLRSGAVAGITAILGGIVFAMISPLLILLPLLRRKRPKPPAQS